MADTKDSCPFSEYNSANETQITGTNMTEVDSLYFAELAYIRFEDVFVKLDEMEENSEKARENAAKVIERYGLQDMLPRNDEFKEKVELLKQLDEDEMYLSDYANLAKLVETNPDKLAMLDSLATDPRYAKCTVSGCKSVFNDTEQWAAITINLNDKEVNNGEDTAVIAYRGTDGTEIGWKEDFEMAYSLETDAQKSSAEYLLLYALNNPDKNIILTGHSKGGNDAIYAYLANGEGVRDQVSHVYNFDGPGVLTDNAARFADAYAELDAEKLDSYLPQDSVIGMLLKDHGNTHFVYSDADGIFMQHDAFTWHIREDGSFEPRDQSDLSKFINETLDDTISDLTIEERITLISFLDDLGVFALIAKDEVDKPLSGEDGWFAKIKETLATYDDLSDEEKDRLMNVAGALIMAAASNGWDVAKDKAGDLWEGAKETAGDLWEGAKETAGNLWDGAGDLWNDATNKLGNLFGLSDSKSTASAAAKGAASGASGGAVALSQQVYVLSDTAKKRVSEFYTKLAQVAVTIAGKLEEFAKNLMDAIESVAKVILEKLKNNTFSKGSKKSYNTDNLNVSVTVLRQVVANLESAQRKIYNLDWKLDSLRSKLYAWEVCDQAKVAALDYTMTGSNIVQNLAEHSFSAGYDWEISACISYLNEVIKKLEKNEDDLVAKAGNL